MPKKLPLTLACGNYEIVRPLIDGTVEVDGVELNILTAGPSPNWEVFPSPWAKVRKSDGGTQVAAASPAASSESAA